MSIFKKAGGSPVRVIERIGDSELAQVYVASFRDGPQYLAEFVDARDPELPKDKKWVIIVSTQFGCPVACEFCDAGGDFSGNLTAEEIFSQIDHVISNNPPSRIFTSKFKIQFARMGEPSLNAAVLDVLDQLPRRYDAHGLIPCIATIAPRSAAAWFERLLSIRHGIYSGRDFQLQLSINTTDDILRDRMMPVPKLSLRELGDYVQRFHEDKLRKSSLNFALMSDFKVDPAIIADNFDPKYACIKLTPLNPTMKSMEMGIENGLIENLDRAVQDLAGKFNCLGFDVIISIGDLRENEIGSNCGMAVKRLRTGRVR